MRTPKDVSEYNRVEVFYDVLLPWLMEGNAEPMSHQMVRESRSASLWRTPQRSNVSGTRSVLDAICHILSAGRVSLPAIKCFKTAIRFEAYRKSVEDLVLAARRFDPPRDTPMHNHIQDLIVQGIDPKSLNLSFNDIFDAVVADDKDGVGVKGEMGQPLHREYFQGKITAVYVGASWCAPCQKVAPRIVEAFQSIYEKSRRGQGPPASVIYFGADRDEKSYFEYIKKLTGFCRAVWPCRQAMEELQVYTQSIPTLIIFDENGLLVTTQGVKAVLRDPEAKDFPNGLWRGASPLGDTDVALFGISCRQLVYDARKKCAAGILKETYLDKVIQLVTSASLLVETFPKSGEFALTTVESMALDCRTPSSKFTIWDLLRRGSIDEYIGREYSSSEGVVCDLSVFKRSANMHELHTVLTAAVQRVSVLWGRAKTSGASSRVALQLEIVEFISWLMVEIVPIPNLNSPETCIYVQPFHSDSDQFQMLDAIHSLLLSFATAWQAVDPPTRAHDSERAIVSACSLVSFEAIARSQAPNSSQQCQVLAFLMNHERGLRFSSSSCQSNRSFEEISRSFELRRPQYLFAREQLLRYFRTSKERFRDEIFDIHQAHKLELRMHSNTIHFVTNYIQQCGYELIPRRQQMRTPEMEVIMTWLLDPNSKLNSERREFSLTRNVVLMCKFLFTMDQRDAQLWRKKKERDRHATWRLSFEEEGPGQHLSASWRTSPSEPRWEYLGLRGADQDIADFEVKGFGDRQIDYGEGLVVQSPTNLSAMLGGCLHPMEDDVLHFENLPSFGGILSSDESEVLLSCLSVEHLRIPLILDFFSSQDRYMHLFSVKLQNLLRAVLLEPGSFLPRSDFRDAEHIPLRMNAHQKEVLRRQQHSSATAPRDDSLLLGTEYGLLFNELMFSHEAVFRPLSFFVKTIQEFGDCSVYSLSTSYILFMVGIVVDVLNVSMFVMAGNLPQGKIEEIRSEHKNLGLQLRSSVKSLFQSWLSEATKNDDIPTSCVLHSYKALLFLTILPDERTKNDFRDMMASSAFVRSRHGFAMGMMRSQLSAQEGEVSLTPEQRLLRFLQAQGLDSSQVSQEQLKRGSELSLSGGKRRAIFVHIRGMFGTDSVRVPNLERVDASCAEDAKKFKLPPADVPESAIMAMMQDCFKDVVTFLAACSPEDLNHIMQAIVSVVLLGQEGSVNIWIPKTGEYGVYFCRNTEMIFRANFCELLWRNEGLKSVPDTMASYDDYKYILGNDVNQCGRVRRSKNMHWVHVVGTQYDLVEWTPPDPMNQGLNCPQTISAPPCEICGLKGQCWSCKTPSCRGAIVCSSSRCGVCRAPKSQSESAEAISQAWFQGVEYCREINVYDEIAWPVIEERWAVDMIRSVFKLHFPQEGECVMKPLLQKDPHGSHVTEITVICNDAIQFKDDSQKSTWKEIIVTKEPLRLQVFNLVSHARRMFRSLVYTSNQKFSLHSLSSVDRKLEREIFFKFKDEAGSFKKRVANESTLEIRRKNQKLFGDESYVPSRLLQGVVPSVLLENFDFWMGTDEVLRGSSSGSLHWFDYSIEAEIHSNPELGGATITRRSDKQFSRISADPKQAALLRRGTVTPRTQHCIDDLAAYFPELSIEALQIALSVCDMNVASATEWLKVPENFARVSVSATSPGAVRTMSSGSPGSPKFASPTSPKAATFGSTINEDDRDTLTLLNLTKWEADGSIKELSLMLSRVEDVSHILVWGIWNAESCNYDIVSVELPRLRARFQPDVGADGIKRLYFLDHPGWFVCCDSSETSLNHLTSLFDCHLLLQNESLEIALLVPNHEIRWAKIFDEPFCTTLLYDRASLLWQESVPTPFYFYVVHTCKQFLVPPSLAASLYLVASLMFKQKFAAAMRLMESCYIDTSASPEEQFMLSIIEKTESDRSPDAHACRLKLVHSIMYSDLPLPKFMSTDLHKYLDKYRQVSEQCRLSSTETIDLLKRCDRPSRLVKAQLMFCKASVDRVDSIELQCDALQWPGQPWRKLCNITAQSMENEASKLARIQYKSEDYSTPLSNELLIQFIWDDTLLCDTESGTTRQTGFMFLYFLLTKRIHAKLFDRDIDLPLGQLLSRWFHLKLARWGKEVVGENEREITPSFQMAVCMGLQYDPTLPWPQIDDEETISQLAHGADVRPRYDHQPQRRARPNRLPDFFSNLTSCLRRAISGPLTPMAARMREIMASIPREFYYNTITNLSPRLFGRLLPSNYQCSEYDLADCQSLLSPEHFACLLNMPLGQIQLDEYIQTSEVTSTKSDQLPFDISRHPSTSSLVARDIISRLKQDMAIFCAQNKSLRHSFFAALPASSVEHIVKGSPDSDACIERCLSMLKDLKIKLQAMRESDNELILKLSHICVSEANAHSGNLSDPAIRDHVLQTIQGSRNKLTFDWICGAALSSSFSEDVLSRNPFARNLSHCRAAAMCTMLVSNRVHFAGQALLQCNTLARMIQEPSLTRQDHDSQVAFRQMLLHTRQLLSDTLICKRQYVQQINNKNLIDPRFLVFEFLFNIVLRKRQVEMVRWFVQNARDGISRVQQMIMGQGKTTVVGPLLALILADGATLVTQVMPTALLDQSRTILRKCFSVLIPKRIYTLKFDRNIEDSSRPVMLLAQKLESARSEGAIICAAPESIKALFLKFVEQLHSIEAMPPVEEEHHQRLQEQSSRLQERAENRALMADAIVPIFDLWKSGVLIMDEVDVLLHSLRSELNFPIGEKKPIDLSGPRWFLPLHIFDGLFFRMENRVTSSFLQTNPEAVAILEAIVASLQRGLACRALQREPHIVLLVPHFYFEDLGPAMLPWVLLWLRSHLPIDFSEALVKQYLIEPNVLVFKEAIEREFTATAIELLNLARNWMTSILPHVLSKINRVGFGLLQAADLTSDADKMPLSRKLSAVPFIAKDVPSRSSEFAHPDVVIGTTILAFRYEGLRLTDVRDVLVQMKQDFSLQTGPAEKRPASKQFRHWLSLVPNHGKAVSHLSQLQVRILF
jgi:thiol-disulfide isomerase/thioredoxin